MGVVFWGVELDMMDKRNLLGRVGCWCSESKGVKQSKPSELPCEKTWSCDESERRGKVKNEGLKCSIYRRGRREKNTDTWPARNETSRMSFHDGSTCQGRSGFLGDAALDVTGNVLEKLEWRWFQ